MQFFRVSSWNRALVAGDDSALRFLRGGLDPGPPGGRVGGEPLLVSTERATRSGVSVEIMFHVFWSAILVASESILVFGLPVFIVVGAYVVRVYAIVALLLRTTVVLRGGDGGMESRSEWWLSFTETRRETYSGKMQTRYTYVAQREGRGTRKGAKINTRLPTTLETKRERTSR